MIYHDPELAALLGIGMFFVHKSQVSGQKKPKCRFWLRRWLLCLCADFPAALVKKRKKSHTAVLAAHNRTILCNYPKGFVSSWLAAKRLKLQWTYVMKSQRFRKYRSTGDTVLNARWNHCPALHWVHSDFNQWTLHISWTFTLSSNLKKNWFISIFNLNWASVVRNMHQRDTNTSWNNITDAVMKVSQLIQ